MKPFLFLTVPYTRVRQKPVLKASPEFGVNILLDTIDIDIATILRFTVERNTPFIVSLSELMPGDSGNDVFYNKLYLLLALSNGFGEAQTDIPVFVKAKDYDAGRLDKLKEFFTKQGEHTINFAIVEPDGNGVLNDILYCSRKHIESFSEGQLQNYLIYNIKKAIINQEEEPAPNTAFDTLLNHNKYAAMLATFIAHNSDAEFYRHQSQLWQHRSMLYLNFIQLGKRISQDEYYGLKHWYTKEYEVLPLWYKQFGHIIKVFMGKRSFKSLFRDEKI